MGRTGDDVTVSLWVGRTGDDVTGSLATGSRNPNMDAAALWYGMVNMVFAVMCNVIF